MASLYTVPYRMVNASLPDGLYIDNSLAEHSRGILPNEQWQQECFCDAIMPRHLITPGVTTLHYIRSRSRRLICQRVLRTP